MPFPRFLGLLVCAPFRLGRAQAWVLLGGLLVAAVASPAAVWAEDPPTTYTVAPGDTLWAIGARHGVAPADIAAANQLPNPNLIRVGQELIIPVPTEEAAEPRRHSVAPGDTLRAIAARYGMAPAGIAAANQLADPNLIRVGQELIIPVPTAEAPEPRRHSVAPGDTLRAIAARYGVEPGALAEANDLRNPDILEVGQELLVPAAEERPHPSSRGGARAAEPAPPPQPSSRIVPVGETIRAQITAYCLQGRMASGNYVYDGAAAGDPSVFPRGTVVEVDDWGTFVIEDTFARDLGQQRVDIWVDDCAQARQWGLRYRQVTVVGRE